MSNNILITDIPSLDKKVENFNTIFINGHYDEGQNFFIQAVENFIKNNKFKIQYDDWMQAAVYDGKNYTELNAILLSKDNISVWNPLYYLRPQIAPYKVNGKPRGWFYNKDKKPVRYTGFGNSFLISLQQNNKLFPFLAYDILVYIEILLCSNIGDTVTFYTKEIYNYEYICNLLERKAVILNEPLKKEDKQVQQVILNMYTLKNIINQSQYNLLK